MLIPYRCKGSSGWSGAYSSDHSNLKDSIPFSTEVIDISRAKTLRLSTQMLRMNSLHRNRIKGAVISVHPPLFDSAHPFRVISASFTFAGYLVVKFSVVMMGRGPCASVVRMSKKQRLNHISRRTWVSIGLYARSSPSQWSPLHSATRMAAATREECTRDTSSRHRTI